MGFLSFLGVLSPAQISWFTFVMRRERVGEDAYGNQYYRSLKPRSGTRRERRWVIYNGVPEASAVPPEWHGWLHYQTDSVPGDGAASFRRGWQRPPRPNMTGTDRAYRPPGHLLKGGVRDKASGDYERWSPPE